jgi:hypothetical protein
MDRLDNGSMIDADGWRYPPTAQSGFMRQGQSVRLPLVQSLRLNAYKQAGVPFKVPLFCFRPCGYQGKVSLGRKHLTLALRAIGLWPIFAMLPQIHAKMISFKGL